MDEKRSERIENKIDTLIEKTGEHEVHLAEIKKDLQYHIKRTDILEKKVVPVWIAYKVAGAIIALLGIGTMVFEILEYFK